MAKSLFLSREVKVYVEFDSVFWELPVLDGFSFSQGTNIAEVTVLEMADSTNNSRRGRLAFNDSLNAAEWSFSTYARPTVVSTKHRATEEILWALMAGARNYAATESSGNIFDDAASSAVTVINSDTTDMSINFAGSNKLTMADANIWFRFPANDAGGTDSDLYYKCEGAVVNEASMTFDLDGITTIEWSGFAKVLKEVAFADAPANVKAGGTVTSHGITSTSNFIRNRLTTLTLDATNSQSGIEDSPYNLVLTGGSITISNNIEFITPSSLGVVNLPLGHVNGTRTVSGSFTCYLDGNTRGSADLFEDLSTATSIVQNEFALTFGVGGATAPKLTVVCPTAMLEIPSHSVEDVISVEVNFHALPTDIANTDEVTINYFGA